MNRGYCLHANCRRLQFRETGWCWEHKEDNAPIIESKSDLWWTEIDESLDSEENHISNLVEFQCSHIMTEGSKKGERCGHINKKIIEGGFCHQHQFSSISSNIMIDDFSPDGEWVLHNQDWLPSTKIASHNKSAPNSKSTSHNEMSELSPSHLIAGLVIVILFMIGSGTEENNYNDYESQTNNAFGCSFVNADLSGVDLTDYWWQKENLPVIPSVFTWDSTGGGPSGLDLSRCDFSNANLNGADLSGANLKNTKFINSDLTNADLTGSVFSNTILTNANLTNARLSIFPVSDYYYPICTDVYNNDWKGSVILMNNAICTGLICPDGYPIGDGLQNPDAMDGILLAPESCKW